MEGPEAEQHVRQGIAVLRKYMEEQVGLPTPSGRRPCALALVPQPYLCMHPWLAIRHS